MKDFTLAILFLTQSAMSIRGFEESKSTTVSDPAGNGSLSISQRPSGRLDLVKHFMTSLLHVLLHASPYTDGLFKVIEPVIER